MHAVGDEKARRRERLMAVPVGVRLRRLARRLSQLRWPTRAELGKSWATALETEAKARSTFFLVPIGLMIGIAITDGAGFRMGLAPAMAVALPMLVWALHRRGRGLLGAAVLLLACVAAGMVLALGELRWTKTTIFSGEATVRIEGRVAWRDRDERDRMRYLVRIERTERPTLSRPPELASILVSSRHETIPVGGRFEGLVRLRAPSGPAYPGAYDFAFAPFFEGRGANGFALGPPEPPGTAAIEPTIGERLVQLRLAMSDRIRAVIGGGAGAVASALITGERSGIPDDINDALRATGLSHVLSISGLHMALVAGFAMVLVRGLLAAIPGAALTLPTKKIAAVAALAVATAYLVISGSDVATDRSYVMLAIMLVAILVDRPALTLRNVAIAAITVMMTTPHAVVTASFQMSFSATAALVGVYGAFSRHRSRQSDGRSKRHVVVATVLFLLGLAASSAIAGAATAPYAAYHFQRIAPYGVIANLIAVPIFSFWIMPLALIAALAMPFGLDAPFLILIGWALDLVFAMAEILAAHFPDAPSGRLTTLGLLVTTAALMLACLSASRLRWGAVPLAALGLLLLPDRSVPPDLLIYEDGRELATIEASGQLHPLRRRPNDFVFDQWTRAFSNEKKGADAQPLAPRAPSTTGEASSLSGVSSADLGYDAPSSSTAFECKSSPLPHEDRDATTADAEAGLKPDNSSRQRSRDDSPRANAETPSPTRSDRTTRDGDQPQTTPSIQGASLGRGRPQTPPARPVSDMVAEPAASGSSPLQTTTRTKPATERQICRAVTRNGLRIVWTDDYRLLGTICDTADIAIVARAVARRECRSGARLVTLRTLRETGSIAVYRPAGSDQAVLKISITDPEEPWNRHRRAPWPEHWRKPASDADNGKLSETSPVTETP